MKVAISGGTGLIGRALVKALLDKGHEPIVLSRSPERVTGKSKRVLYRKWNPPADDSGVDTSGDALAGALADVDAVVNLAGEPIDSGRWTQARKQRIRDSRVIGNRRIVEALSRLEKKPRTFIAGSAVGYYGSCGDTILDEKSPPGGNFLAGVCRDLEGEATRAEELGLRVVALRTGVVLSPSGGALQRMLTPFRLCLGGRLGDGNQWFPWIHESDLAGIIVHCLENDTIAGPINGTAPGAVTNRDFTLTLGRVLKRPTPFPMPLALLRLLFGEMAGVLVSSHRTAADRITRLGYEFRYEDVEKALENVISK
jgi:uncharacterized protein